MIITEILTNRKNLQSTSIPLKEDVDQIKAAPEGAPSDHNSQALLLFTDGACDD